MTKKDELCMQFYVCRCGECVLFIVTFSARPKAVNGD